ncbi:MAG: hypothetical protein M3256_16845 [Actinomycetota bacterium]|nr:hypothetical protein [Actinomycetota bacterium]
MLFGVDKICSGRLEETGEGEQVKRLLASCPLAHLARHFEQEPRDGLDRPHVVVQHEPGGLGDRQPIKQPDRVEINTVDGTEPSTDPSAVDEIELYCPHLPETTVAWQL